MLPSRDMARIDLCQGRSAPGGVPAASRGRETRRSALVKREPSAPVWATTDQTAAQERGRIPSEVPVIQILRSAVAGAGVARATRRDLSAPLSTWSRVLSRRVPQDWALLFGVGFAIGIAAGSFFV